MKFTIHGHSPKIGLALLVASLFLLLPVWSFAQSTELFWQEAQDLFKQGRKLAIKKQYKRALIKYVAAINLLKRAEQKERSATVRNRYRSARVSMLYVIGRTYQLDKQPVKAYKAYRSSLQGKPNARLQSILKRFMTQLRPQVLSRVTIECQPPHASISVKDVAGKVYTGRRSLTLNLEPGTTIINIKAPGYQPTQTTLTLEARKEITRTFSLTPMRIRTPPKRIITRQRPLPTNNNNKIGDNIVMWMGIAFAVIGTGAGIATMVAGDQQESKGLACQGQTDKPECKGETSQTIADNIDGGRNTKIMGGLFLGIGAIGITLAIVFGLGAKAKTPPPTTATKPAPSGKSVLPTP
jgi:tetratricopeptide (TPR) repeat protein